MSLGAIGSSGGFSSSSLGSTSRVADEEKDKEKFQLGGDNIFAANFDNSKMDGIDFSSGTEETSGTLASNGTDGLFEESAGTLANNNNQDWRDMQLEESAGNLAQGGFSLVA